MSVGACVFSLISPRFVAPVVVLFRVHCFCVVVRSLKNAAVPLASYRASFDAPTSDWQTVRIPWKDFEGFGSDVPLDTASLARVGVVAIGRNMDVVLGIAGVRFYEE